MRKSNAGFTLKSKAERMTDKVDKFPAPGKYKISRDILKKKPFKIRGPMSSFAKTVRKKEINIKEKDKVKDKINKGKPLKAFRGSMEDPTPGPGEYNEERAKDFKQYFKPMSLKGNSFFLQGPKRFKLDKEKVRNPGPGTYKSKDPFEVDKYKVYGAVFMSETERNAFNVQKLNDRFAPFDPSMKPVKESFHFNIKAKPKFIP